MENATLLEKFAEDLKIMGRPAKFMPRSKSGLSLDMISLPLFPEGHAYSEVTLSFSLYPLNDAFEQSNFLQAYSQLPFILEEQTLGRAIALLPHLNEKSPVGHFGINVESGSMYYRFVLLLGKNEQDAKHKLNDMISLVTYSFSTYQPVFELLRQGESFEGLVNALSQVVG